MFAGMLRARLLIGALMLSAPILWCGSGFPADPILVMGQLRWFTLRESPAEVAAVLGQPILAASTGSDHLSWQFRLDGTDHHEFSHVLVFRKSTGKLVSVTRLYAEERDVDEFFPPMGTTVHHYPGTSVRPFGLRLRRLPGGRLLLAIGSTERGVPTGQLVLVHESELPSLYPWLAEQLRNPR